MYAIYINQWIRLGMINFLTWTFINKFRKKKAEKLCEVVFSFISTVVKEDENIGNSLTLSDGRSIKLCDGFVITYLLVEDGCPGSLNL